MRWLCLFFLCAAAVPARAFQPSDFAFAQHPGAAIPFDTPLTDEAGRPTTLRDVASGRPLLIAFGYFHCPNICGVVRDDVFNALDGSGLKPPRDVELAFVTIDPAETATDAAAAKRADLARYPTDPAGAHFLTGPATSLAALAQSVGFRSRYDADLKQFLHPAGLVFATGEGAVSGYLLGVGYSPGDVRAAVTRAANGEIGQEASPLLLLCFHFDPTTGRYTLAIIKVLRLGAVLTVLMIGGVVVLAQRRRRSIMKIAP